MKDLETIIVEEFLNSVRYVKNPVKNFTPCAVKIDGKFAQLGNTQKSVWKRPRDAKLALRNHFDLCQMRLRIEKLQNVPYKEAKERAESIFQKFLAEHVEIVKL